MRAKLTPAIVATILKAARLGASMRTCARAAGLGKSTLANWLDRGADDTRGPYADLFIAFERAQAERELEALKVIRARADNWQAAAWYLERKAPEFARRVAVDATTAAYPDGEPSSVVVYIPSNNRGDADAEAVPVN